MAASEIEIAFGPLEKFTERNVKKIILGVAANLIEDTPVDTGHAANNWIPSIAQPVEDVDGSHESPSSGAQSAGLAEVAGGYHLPAVAYVSNNVPYIGALNDGHSGQAPRGFVQAAAIRAVRDASEGS